MHRKYSMTRWSPYASSNIRRNVRAAKCDEVVMSAPMHRIQTGKGSKTCAAVFGLSNVNRSILLMRKMKSEAHPYRTTTRAISVMLADPTRSLGSVLDSSLNMDCKTEGSLT